MCVRVCIIVRTPANRVLRPRESFVYTFQYGKQTPLANKYSLDVFSSNTNAWITYHTTRIHIFERSNASRNAENFWNDAFLRFVTRVNERVNSDAGWKKYTFFFIRNRIESKKDVRNILISVNLCAMTTRQVNVTWCFSFPTFFFGQTLRRITAAQY